MIPKLFPDLKIDVGQNTTCPFRPKFAKCRISEHIWKCPGWDSCRWSWTDGTRVTWTWSLDRSNGSDPVPGTTAVNLQTNAESWPSPWQRTVDVYWNKQNKCSVFDLEKYWENSWIYLHFWPVKTRFPSGIYSLFCIFKWKSGLFLDLIHSSYRCSSKLRFKLMFIISKNTENWRKREIFSKDINKLM